MAEKSVELDSIELAAAIFGNCDQNVKLLENEFHVTAVCRGSLLKFTGEPKDVEAAVHAVDGMVTLMQNHTPLEEQTVRYCISLARGGEEKRLRELNDDLSPLPPKAAPSTPKRWARKSTSPPSAPTPSPLAWGLPVRAKPTWLWPWRSRRSSQKTSAALF